jgi:hypothetical protein
MTEPDWARDPVQREIQRCERRMLVKQGKRKSRDESESSGIASRDRSTTLAPADTTRQPAIHRSIETPMEGPSSQLMTQTPIQVRRGTFTATRGGEGRI